MLIAEDHILNRTILKTLLEAAGYSVRIAMNGAEAVEAARREALDAAVLDNHMPIMSGLAAARAIRLLPGGQGRTPLIAYSAGMRPADARTFLEAGFDEVVEKPSAPEMIFRAIDRAIAARAA